MRKLPLLLTLIAITFLFIGCSKTTDFDITGYQNEAVIIGYYELEECTGGYALNILGDSRYSKLLFTLELPSDAGITPGSIFPIKVAIDWEKDEQYCPNGDYIIIQELKKM